MIGDPVTEVAVPASKSRRIIRLNEAVVNRIAAGEIIQRPANALKELIENSIDAQATSIEILVKDGGLKLLQITDNGTGIHKDDMEILCERFTTSKLREFNDLNSMTTYGFRGEALASITHISHVTVTTKTENAACAFRAFYEDGKLAATKPGSSAEPKPIAGNKGTQITSEDMFYNIPSRRRALSKPNEEYAKIIDVVNRYAIHCEGIAFSLKKHGEKAASVLTSQRNTVTDNIRLIYGTNIANELLAFETENAEYRFKARGLVTNANYHVKKMTFLLFINQRSVESTTIKRAIEALYQTFLPKGTHPFVYVSLTLDPAKIDVNVHPTKREVNILNEDEILAILSTTISKRLAETDNSRSFYAQTLLPGAAPLDAGISSEKIRRSINMSGPQNPATFVRTDSKQQKIVSMLDPSFQGQKQLDLDSTSDEALNGKGRVTIKLASVKELRSEVRDSIHEDLTAIFTEHVFVGIVDLDRRLATIQHLTKLYVVDYGAVGAELFYQIGLSEFGNFGTIKLNPPLNLRDLLCVAFNAHQLKQDEFREATADERDTHVNATYTKLISRKEMLLEYFSIEISSAGELKSIPMLMRDYTPALSKLPNFFLRLGFKVDWETEKGCFDSFLRELALFYVPEVLAASKVNKPAKLRKLSEHQADDNEPGLAGHQDLKEKEEKLRHSIENVLFPAFKKRLIAPKSLATDKRVCQIANLPDLYKTFERC